MNKEQTSIDIYNELIRIKCNGVSSSDTNVDQKYKMLFNKIKEELIIYGYSELFDLAYNTCNIKNKDGYSLKTIFVSQPSKKNVINLYDVFCIVSLLPGFLLNEKYLNMNGDILEKFCINYNYKGAGMSLQFFLEKLEKIDKSLIKIRKQLLSNSFNNTKESKENNVDQYDKRTLLDKPIDMSMSMSKIEEENNIILKKAKEEANNIIEKANRIFEQRIAEARKRIVVFSNENRLKSNFESQKQINDNFNMVRDALLRTNETFKKLENSINVRFTEKVFTRFLELYNLIVDTRNSMSKKAINNSNAELEMIIHNLNIYLDMIVEYLADFGVKTICTSPGNKFSVRDHELVGDNNQCDYRALIVRKSLRNGFVWDEQIIQKEQVYAEVNRSCI